MAFGKAKPPVDIAWRTDFRMPERLPDIKPVRTDFFINFGAVSFAVFALVVAGFQEYTIHSAKTEIDDKVSELISTASNQDTYSKQNTSFVKTEVFLKEFVLFSAKEISASDLLVMLKRDTPKEITLESVNQVPLLRNKVIVTSIDIIGYVRDADTTRAYATLDQFLQTLFKSNELKGKVVANEKSEKDFVKDAERGVVKFKARLEISPKPLLPAKPGAK